jgi:GTP-dependent phosphoenolpyruvate carboxykinase
MENKNNNTKEIQPSAIIVLRMTRAQKGRYVLASRNEKKKLYEWITEKLDQASEDAAREIEGRESEGGC